MSQISEVKCANCGQWSTWTGKVGERCPHCNQYLEPGRVLYAEEKRLITERNRDAGYLVIHENDDPIIKILKEFVNWIRWGTFYGISVIYIVIAIAIVLYGVAIL
jgi:hypothetical protein